MWSADRFVDGASGIAEYFGLSPLIIGLTVVSIGTSAPEIFVSANAALDASSGIAVGNALGSNLANMGLVLGITALICPLAVNPTPARREGVIMLLVCFAAGAVLFDSFLGRIESLALVFCLGLFITYLIRTSSKDSEQATDAIDTSANAELQDTTDQAAKASTSSKTSTSSKASTTSLTRASLTTAYGLILLVVSARVLVWSASGIASNFGVSDLVIGVTVVAVGTSLPELAASLSSAFKGQSDIAIGNVLGSNIFNFLAVLPVAGIIFPMQVDGINFYRDFGAVLLLSVLFIGACLWKTRTGEKGVLGRPSGVVLLAIYASYYYFLLA